MKEKKLSASYREISKDRFPSKVEISFYDSFSDEHDDSKKQTLYYEKTQWTIGGEEKGLRYGENPGQPAALYRLINGNLQLGDVHTIEPGQYLASDIELIQSGKHPGKTNITDVDNALNILRYFDENPCAVIVKHNNPCGVALGNDIADAYRKADLADRIAAFGGAITLNKPVTKEAAEEIAAHYCEVVAAPEYEEGTLAILTKKKNLRIMRIGNMDKLSDFIGKRVIDAKSLIDGGIIFQWSYVPKVRTPEDFLLARTEYKGKIYEINRQPTAGEAGDLIFGWLVESGITSNSVIYVKDGVTIGIGTGEQDRVGVAEIARDKAYRKMADRLSWVRWKTSWHTLEDPDKRKEIEREVESVKGGLQGAAMISDAFFPFRDGIEVGLKEGVQAVIQPGGSLRDFESIEACNDFGAAMVFTGQRSFKH